MRPVVAKLSALSASFCLTAIAGAARAEGLGLIGPSQGETQALFGFPVFLGILLLLVMVFTGHASGVIIAILLSLVWCLIVVVTLGIGVGFLMLLLTPWAILAFLVLGFVIAHRATRSNTPATWAAEKTWKPIPVDLGVSADPHVAALVAEGYQVTPQGPERWRVVAPGSQVIRYVRTLEELQAILSATTRKNEL